MGLIRSSIRKIGVLSMKSTAKKSGLGGSVGKPADGDQVSSVGLSANDSPAPKVSMSVAHGPVGLVLAGRGDENYC